MSYRISMSPHGEWILRAEHDYAPFMPSLIMGQPAPVFLSVSPRYYLDGLRLTLSQARALRDSRRGMATITVDYDTHVLASDIELTENEAREIASGGDPLGVLLHGPGPRLTIRGLTRAEMA